MVIQHSPLTPIDLFEEQPTFDSERVPPFTAGVNCVRFQQSFHGYTVVESPTAGLLFHFHSARLGFKPAPHDTIDRR